MSLNASMWTGVSGLRGHGQQMGVIGNNIANVSTVGFKGSRMHFEDFMSQSVGTASGPGQVGRGVAVGAILGDFSQGSLETTNESTDVAITGNGFFQVSPPGEDINYYTRAGNFRFDKDGFLIDPHGYRVQGWVMEDGGPRENPVDVELENFQSPPAETKNINFITNLDSRSEQFDTDSDIVEDWDGTQEPPIAANNYTYQTTMKVYDENGGSHNLTVYYRQREPGDDDNPSEKYWQFLVTSDPLTDKRFEEVAGESGLLFDGEMVFSAAGELTGFSYLNTYYADPPADDPEANPVEEGDMRNGFPLAYADFLGTSKDDGAEFPDAYQAIELDFGVILDPENIPDDAFIPIEKRDALSSTSYSSSSTTLFQAQDGYTAGFLQNVSVSRDGVLTGRYSNGQVQDLYALTISDFNNVWGLRREGGNLFAETKDSGPAYTGVAGTGRFGTVAGNSLELSNVDLATEFVKMISTQKGFQANSKTITTVDMMLDEVIRMKR